MAKKKAEQSANTTKQYKEDIIFFRISALFIIVCAALVGIFRLQSITSNAFYRLAHNPMFIVALGLVLLVAVGYWIYCKVNRVDESVKSFASINYVAVMAYIFCFCLYWGSTLYPRFDVIMTLTIALPLLYIIYHIYKKDFFIFSAANLLFIAAMWFFIRGGLLFTVAAAVALAASAASCYVAYISAKKNNGKEKYRHRFEPVCISFLIAVILIVLRSFIEVAFLNSSIVWAIMLFQYLAGGIYYTIKLIREA